MKSLKSLSILAILAAFGVVVYSYVNSLPEPVPPPGIPRDWNAGAAARIDMSGMQQVEPGRDMFAAPISEVPVAELPAPVEEDAGPPPPDLAEGSLEAGIAEAPVPAAPPIPEESIAQEQPMAGDAEPSIPMADVQRTWLLEQRRNRSQAGLAAEPLASNSAAQTAAPARPQATSPPPQVPGEQSDIFAPPSDHLSESDEVPATTEATGQPAGLAANDASAAEVSAADLESQDAGQSAVSDTLIAGESASAPGTGDMAAEQSVAVDAGQAAEAPAVPLAVRQTESAADATTTDVIKSPVDSLGPPTSALPPPTPSQSLAAMTPTRPPTPTVSTPQVEQPAVAPNETPPLPSGVTSPPTDLTVDASPATRPPLPHEQSQVSPKSVTNEFSAAAGPADMEPSFDVAWTKAVDLLQQGKLDGALEVLSKWYKHPSLRPEEQHELTGLLGQLAGTVIYSEQHHLEPPYVVQQEQESLADIASQYQVPPALLARINGVEPDATLSRGQALKVVRGPFEGEVRMVDRELVLKLRGRYAGRFRVGVGEQAQEADGEYFVRNKKPDRAYYATNRTIRAGDAENPYAKHWIGLSRSVDSDVQVPFGLHGSWDTAAVDSDDSRGCLRLTPQDAADVYDILSVGSRVRVLR